MSDKLMFQSGKADVQSKGKEALKVLADVLKKNPEFQILVEGHTDNVPIKTATYKDNWDLSVARATSMVRSEEHTSELQSRPHLVCRLLLEKKKKKKITKTIKINNKYT